MMIQEVKTYLKVYNLTLAVTDLHFKIRDIKGRLLLSSQTWQGVVLFIRRR